MNLLRNLFGGRKNRLPTRKFFRCFKSASRLKAGMNCNVLSNNIQNCLEKKPMVCCINCYSS